MRTEENRQEFYEFWLAGIQAIPGRKKIRLKSLFPEPEELYRLKPAQVSRIPFLTDLDKERLQESQRQPEAEIAGQIETCRETGISLVLREDASYPSRLRDIYNPPYALYCRGSLPEDARPAVALVGARNCSPYGKAVAKSVACHLAMAGLSVISGLAAGIDGAAHQGALRAGGWTYAVLGCGADVCYPACHRQLYEALAMQGGVISEYPPGAKPLPMNFPQRNRLISGLSDAVLVVEAREKSGALITADFALEQGKEVYAVPGRVSDAASGGTNRLIRQGAGIFLSAEDFLGELGFFAGKQRPTSMKQKITLEKLEMLLYSCLGFNPKNLDDLMEETALPLEAVLANLSSLQEKGCVSEIYKNYFVRAEIVQLQ